MIVKGQSLNLILREQDIVTSLEKKIRKDYGGLRRMRIKKLILECEPNNKYDNHAVAVFANILKSDYGKTERTHLGYTPKYYSEEIFNKLSNPYVFNNI